MLCLLKVEVCSKPQCLKPHKCSYLGGQFFLLHLSCGASTFCSCCILSHLWNLLHALMRRRWRDLCPLKGLQRTAPSLDSWTDLLLLQPNPLVRPASSHLSLCGGTEKVLWPRRSSRETRRLRYTPLRPLQAAWFVFKCVFSLLSALWNDAPSPRVRRRVCVLAAGMTWLMKELVEAAAFGAFTYGLRKHFLQEPFFLFMSNPVFDSQVHFPQVRWSDLLLYLLYSTFLPECH